MQRRPLPLLRVRIPPILHSKYSERRMAWNAVFSRLRNQFIAACHCRCTAVNILFGIYFHHILHEIPSLSHPVEGCEWGLGRGGAENILMSPRRVFGIFDTIANVFENCI
ncbi:hypothetical protein CEXT_231501 [Caerostris extrusa]|uniref:Uncharacterized protein n=1 Tax=Caerostris extrusa TaxID=172846 RepID=A0AAV4T3G5_CAEEX|nr:hypothetical protein CEXT_231501 [Caerostris extrusa]